MQNAIITGFDERACMCCGGLMITFNGETKPYTGDFKLIENSSDIGISDKASFPIYVKLNWKADTTNPCHRIRITKMVRIKNRSSN